MLKQSQEQWVRGKLLNEGKITRNEALRNYISRLGAIILNLKKSGWEIVGSYESSLFGKDYVYTLIQAPQ